jgi:hypothetical protein
MDGRREARMIGLAIAAVSVCYLVAALATG